MMWDSPKVISDRPNSTKIRKINSRTISLASMPSSLTTRPPWAPSHQTLANGSGGFPRHAVGVVGLDVQWVRNESLNASAEDREVDPLPIVDGRGILLREDVLGFFHQFVELLLALK